MTIIPVTELFNKRMGKLREELIVVHTLNERLAKATLKRDLALLKLIYLATRNIEKKWTSPLQNWSLTVQQLAIRFGDRLPLDLKRNPKRG